MRQYVSEGPEIEDRPIEERSPTPAGPTCVLPSVSPDGRRYAVGPAFGLHAALNRGEMSLETQHSAL